MKLELSRFMVQPITAHRENGRTIGEDHGTPVAVFTAEQFVKLMEVCEEEIAQRNELLAKADRLQDKVEVLAGQPVESD